MEMGHLWMIYDDLPIKKYDGPVRKLLVIG